MYRFVGAADHKDKKRRLKVLKEKAAARNPDEFSFKMLSSTVDKHGIKVADRGNKALDMDVVKLLKTQDAGYIRTMLQVIRKQKQELEEKIVLEGKEVRTVRDGGSVSKGNHTVFVGDRKEQREFKPDEWFGTGDEWPHNRSMEEVEIGEQVDGSEDGAQTKKLSRKQREAMEQAEYEKELWAKKRERAQEKLTGQLQALKTKERALATAEERLENQRAKMNSTIGGTNKAGVKFKLRERKR